jgi:hypothetical protein
MSGKRQHFVNVVGQYEDVICDYVPVAINFQNMAHQVVNVDAAILVIRQLE